MSCPCFLPRGFARMAVCGAPRRLDLAGRGCVEFGASGARSNAMVHRQPVPCSITSAGSRNGKVEMA